MTSIVDETLEKKVEEGVGGDQYGPRGERGTRDSIGIIRTISERDFDVKEEVSAYLFGNFRPNEQIGTH